MKGISSLMVAFAHVLYSDLDFGLHPCFSSILLFDCSFVSAIFKIRRENLQSVYMETIAVRQRLGFRPFRTTSGCVKAKDEINKAYFKL